MAGNQPPAKRPLEDNAETRPAKRPCYDYNTIIAVLVGPTEHRFAVHKDVICAKSKFFRSACSKRWIEYREKRFRLPEVEPRIFKLYIDWAYTDIVGIDPAGGNFDDEVELYLLGDFLDDIKLRNKTIRAMTARLEEQQCVPNFVTVQFIWDHTTPGSLLRKWTVNAVLTLGDDFFVEQAANFPSDLLLQVAVKLKQLAPQNVPEGIAANLPRYLEVEGSDSE